MKRPRRRGLRIGYRVAAWILLPTFAVAQTAPLVPSTTAVTASSQTLLLPGYLTLNGTVAPGGATACCGVPTGNLVFAADGTAPNPVGSAPLQIVPSTQTMAYAANPGPQYPFASAGSPTGLTTGAFFGDGHTDLAVTDSTDPSPTFFQGQGQGQIALNKKVTINGAPTNITSAKAVASGDFTGTGTADLIFLGRTIVSPIYYAPSPSADVVYLNQGNGNFNAVVSPDGAVCNSCSGLVPFDGESITVGNFNANVDAMNDIAYIISQPDLSTGSMGVALNQGKGSFTSFTSIPLPNNFSPVAITSGSFNGNVDLVVAGTEYTTCTISGTSSGPFNGYVAVYPGDGNGDFGIPQTINGVQTFAAPQPICVGENPSAIAVGDFNKDGNLDILVANSGTAESGAPSVQLLFGDGKGGFPTNQTISLSSNSGNLVSLSVADFNGDTYPDFAVYDSNGNLSFYTNNGSASPGQFHLLTSLATAEPAGDGTSAYGAATGDFNSDGFPDIVTFFIQVPPANTTAADGFLWIATDTASAQASLNTPAQSLQAGNRNLTTSFSGDTNFAASTSTPLPVAVSQTVPVITWNPGSIAYPTPLGSAQLNATSTPVPGGGSFAYTPPAGTVLLPPMPSSSTPAPAILKVTFTPADSFDYAPAAASANIFVTLSALSIGSLSPASAIVGATNTPPITVTGTGFETDAVVIFDGSPLPASSVSYSDPDHLMVSLPNSIFSTAATHKLSVNDPIDAEKSSTLVFTVATPTAVGTVNVPPTATPGGEPPTIALSLNSYPVDATVTITLTFTPSSSNPSSTNGSVNFANGTTTDTIVVPANTTTALPPVAFSPGTVAGTISVAFSITAGGVDVTPANLTTPASVTVPAGIPAFQKVTLDCSSTGIQLIVQGYSTTREISAAQAIFTAAPGKSLQTSSFTISGAQQLFTSWYQNPLSDSGGSSFILTQPFTFQSGDSSDIGSVAVTLTNGQGPAQSTTAQCTSSTN